MERLFEIIFLRAQVAFAIFIVIGGLLEAGRCAINRTGVVFVILFGVMALVGIALGVSSYGELRQYQGQNNKEE